MKTKCNVTINFRDYGEIVVPKGTELTHQTAIGYDEKYHFVKEFGWIERDYPKVSNILRMDASSYGIDIPAEFVEYDAVVKAKELKTTKPVVVERFNIHHSAALSKISSIVDKLGSMAIAPNKTWADVGSMEKVSSDLDDICEFLGLNHFVGKNTTKH